MTNDSLEAQEKVERIVSHLFSGRRQQAFWFWLVGLGIVIPTATYGSSTLVAFVLGLALHEIGITASPDVKPIVLTIIVVCAAASLLGYYKLWVFYRQKKAKKLGGT